MTEPITDWLLRAIEEQGNREMSEESLTPNQRYRTEIEKALDASQKRLGDVFRARKEDENKSPQFIADDLGIGTPGPVYSVLRSIETLLECKRTVGGTTSLREKARMIRGFTNRQRANLSPETIQRLDDLAAEHDRYASN